MSEDSTSGARSKLKAREREKERGKRDSRECEKNSAQATELTTVNLKF